MDLNDIATQFYNAGLKYSAGIQPYALKLFFALLLIDILITWIQYSAEGQLDPSYFFGRIIKHILMWCPANNLPTVLGKSPVSASENSR